MSAFRRTWLEGLSPSEIGAPSEAGRRTSSARALRPEASPSHSGSDPEAARAKWSVSKLRDNLSHGSGQGKMYNLT